MRYLTLLIFEVENMKTTISPSYPNIPFDQLVSSLNIPPGTDTAVLKGMYVSSLATEHHVNNIQKALKFTDQLLRVQEKRPNSGYLSTFVGTNFLDDETANRMEKIDKLIAKEQNLDNKNKKGSNKGGGGPSRNRTSAKTYAESNYKGDPAKFDPYFKRGQKGGKNGGKGAKNSNFTQKKCPLCFEPAHGNFPCKTTPDSP